LTSKFKSSKICIPLYEFACSACKEKFGEVWQDDLECEGGRRGRFPGHDWVFDPTVGFPAGYAQCVHPGPLLSCDRLRVAWIALSFGFFDIGSASFCFVDFVFRGIFFQAA
jgi:hypothetical protein